MKKKAPKKKNVSRGTSAQEKRRKRQTTANQKKKSQAVKKKKEWERLNPEKAAERERKRRAELEYQERLQKKEKAEREKKAAKRKKKIEDRERRRAVNQGWDNGAKGFTVKDGCVYQFGYRDYADESNWNSILNLYSNLSFKRLRELLVELGKRETTFAKDIKGSTSSGSAGDGKFKRCDPYVAMSNMTAVENLENEIHKSYKVHKSASKRKFVNTEWLLDDMGNPYFYYLTGKGMYHIMVALLSSVHEENRVFLYRQMYRALEKDAPRYTKDLPEPKLY